MTDRPSKTFTGERLDFQRAMLFDRRVSDSAFRFAAAVLYFVNQSTREAFVTDDRLEVELGASKSKLSRARRELTETGWLAFTPGRRGRATIYRFEFGKTEAMFALRRAAIDGLAETRIMEEPIVDRSSNLTTYEPDRSSNLQSLVVRNDDPTPSYYTLKNSTPSGGCPMTEEDTRARSATLARIASASHARAAILRFLAGNDPERSRQVAALLGTARLSFWIGQLTQRALLSDDLADLAQAADDALGRGLDEKAVIEIDALSETTPAGAMVSKFCSRGAA